MISQNNSSIIRNKINKLVIVKQLLLFYNYLLAYSNGMVEYVKYNELVETRMSIFIGQLIGIVDECIECFKAIFSRDIYLVIAEVVDIWHSIVIITMMTISPRTFWLSKYFWICIAIFTFFGPVSKHAKRYIQYGCVRNHKHCLEKDHICIVNSKARV
jgi:hypothetical protein